MPAASRQAHADGTQRDRVAGDNSERWLAGGGRRCRATATNARRPGFRAPSGGVREAEGSSRLYGFVGHDSGKLACDEKAAPRAVARSTVAKLGARLRPVAASFQRAAPRCLQRRARARAGFAVVRCTPRARAIAACQPGLRLDADERAQTLRHCQRAAADAREAGLAHARRAEPAGAAACIQQALSSVRSRSQAESFANAGRRVYRDRGASRSRVCRRAPDPAVRLHSRVKQ